MKAIILKGLDGYVLKFRCNDKDKLILYCIKHNIDFTDMSNPDF